MNWKSNKADTKNQHSITKSSICFVHTRLQMKWKRNTPRKYWTKEEIYCYHCVRMHFVSFFLQFLFVFLLFSSIFRSISTFPPFLLKFSIYRIESIEGIGKFLLYCFEMPLLLFLCTALKLLTSNNGFLFAISRGFLLSNNEFFSRKFSFYNSCPPTFSHYSMAPEAAWYFPYI